MNRRAVILAAPTLAISTRHAAAQTWPNRPVRFVVGFAPGGANDIMARLLAAKLAERMPGSSFIVENRPGASTVVGAELVARAAPDGTTFFYTSPSTQIAILGANFTATGEVRGPPLSGVVEPGVASEHVSHTKLVLLWVLFGALARCLM